MKRLIPISLGAVFILGALTLSAPLAIAAANPAAPNNHYHHKHHKHHKHHYHRHQHHVPRAASLSKTSW